MTNQTTFRHLPGNLSFKRGHSNSDALFFQIENGELSPVHVVQHGISGTQNVANGTNKDIANPQITQSAKQSPSSNELVILHQIAFLPLVEALHSCASGVDKESSRAFKRSVEGFIKRACSSKGLEEVATRMARNIANGRWVFRNRTLVSSMKVTVDVIDSQNNVLKSIVFENAEKISLHNFLNFSRDEIELGQEIAKQFRGESLNSLDVRGDLTLRVRGGEVFPSQNYLNLDKNDRNKKGFSRSLYKVGSPEPADFFNNRVMGQAALRDQKIFNAIRTIDTWYPSYEVERIPIAVEPLGANLGLQYFCRPGGSSAFELLKRLNTLDPDEADGMFMIASLDRGGVFGESEKERKEKTRATDSASQDSAKSSQAKASSGTKKAKGKK